MSENEYHRMNGQTAIIVFLLLLAVAAALFWNWESLKAVIPTYNPLDIVPKDFIMQLVLIFALMVVVFVLLVIYEMKKPKADRISA